MTYNRAQAAGLSTPHHNEKAAQVRHLVVAAMGSLSFTGGMIERCDGFFHGYGVYVFYARVIGVILIGFVALYAGDAVTGLVPERLSAKGSLFAALRCRVWALLIMTFAPCVLTNGWAWTDTVVLIAAAYQAYDDGRNDIAALVGEAVLRVTFTVRYLLTGGFAAGWGQWMAQHLFGAAAARTLHGTARLARIPRQQRHLGGPGLTLPAGATRSATAWAFP